MAIHKTQAAYDQPQRIRIVIIESERGWGSKVEDVLYADTSAEADAYIKNYNKDLPTDRVPDYYIMARRG